MIVSNSPFEGTFDFKSHINIVLNLSYKVGFVTIVVATAIYALFQKKMLPKSVTKIVSALFFYPTFPITALLRIGNYWSHVDDTVLLGCAPFSILGQPLTLYKLGVRGVVNMCTEYPGPQKAYDELGIKQLRLPTVDHFEPTLIQLREAVKFINVFKNKGERVYVHCKAGHGRGATVVLAWMIYANPTVSSKVSLVCLRFLSIRLR